MAGYALCQMQGIALCCMRYAADSEFSVAQLMLHVLHGATVTDGAVAAVRPLLVARTEAAVDAGAAQTAAADVAVVCVVR